MAEVNPAEHAERGSRGGNRQRYVLIGTVAFYVIAMAAMMALDRLGFVWKSLVVPGLVVAALLSKRFKSFVNDWAVFLAAVVLFDFCRGLVFALVARFDLRVYLAYVIDWERWLCAGEIGPILMQRLRAALPAPGPIDRLLVVVHASHFLFFLLFGFVVWYAHRPAFRQYAWSMVLLMYLGLGLYFLVPTVPPWMAADQFHAIPAITHVAAAIYNLQLPGLVDAFDINPIAAMPSLHAAFPTLCALIALQHFGRRAWFVLAYTLAVWLAIVYLGEHYAVDVLAGVALAVAVFALGRRARAPDEEDGSERLQGRRLVPALALVLLAFGIGQVTLAIRTPLAVTRDFVLTELAGRSDLTHYFLGRIAYSQGAYQEARRELERALLAIGPSTERQDAQFMLAVSAYRLRDFPAAIDALEGLRAGNDSTRNLLLLASAYVENGDYEKGMALFEDGRSRLPRDPEPLYWLTRYAFLHGRIDQAHVRSVIDQLGTYDSEKIEPLRRSLLELLQPGRVASEAPAVDPGVI